MLGHSMTLPMETPTVSFELLILWPSGLFCSPTLETLLFPWPRSAHPEFTLVDEKLIALLAAAFPKLPTVLRQMWSQPPLFKRHSSMSGDRDKIEPKVILKARDK